MRKAFIKIVKNWLYNYRINYSILTQMADSSSMSSSHILDSVVKGHHVYKDYWSLHVYK